MPPAMNLSTAYTTYARPSRTFIGLSPRAAIVLASILCLFVVLSGGSLLLKFVRRRFARKRTKNAPRAFILPNYRDCEVGNGGGPKPLFLPSMATVKSSRGKASILKRFLRQWVIDPNKTPYAPSADEETLNGSPEDTKATIKPSADWAVDHFVPYDKGTADTDANPKHNSKQDNLSVDIADLPPSSSLSCPLTPLAEAPEDCRMAGAHVPAIVVDAATTPRTSLSLDAVAPVSVAADRLQVPPPSWVAPAPVDDSEPAFMGNHLCHTITRITSPPPRPPTFKAKALGAQVMPTVVTSFSPIGLGISLAAAKESERRTGVHKSLTVNRLPAIAVPPRSYSTSYYF